MISKIAADEIVVVAEPPFGDRIRQQEDLRVFDPSTSQDVVFRRDVETGPCQTFDLGPDDGAGNVCMTGPVSHVFEGRLSPEFLAQLTS